MRRPFLKLNFDEENATITNSGINKTRVIKTIETQIGLLPEYAIVKYVFNKKIGIKVNSEIVLLFVIM